MGQSFVLIAGGPDKHSYDGVFLAQRSEDSGQTWSPSVAIGDLTHLTPSQSVNSGGVSMTSDGSLLAIFKTTVVTQAKHHVHSEKGVTQQNIIYTSRSHDGGRTWSPPRRLEVPWDKKIGVAGKPLLLPNNEVFVPLEANLGRGQTTLGGFSSDNGDTIGDFFELGITDPAGRLELCDARFTICGNEIIALLWTFQTSDEQTVQVHRAVSQDSGRTWSHPKPTGFVGQVTVPLAIDNNVIIAASNYRLPPAGIRLWYSEDRGTTWQRPPIQMWDPRSDRIVGQPLDASGKSGENDAGQTVWDGLPGLPEFTFGTPDLVRLHDSTILLTYYATTQDIIHIRACRFTADD